MKQLCINSVRNEVLASLYADQRADALHQLLRSGAEIYIVAGALRDAIAVDLGLCQGEPRDFDITVSNVQRAELDEVLGSFGELNRHGGYVLHSTGAPSWDIWRLEESIGLKKTGTPCSLHAVLRTFNLDCNAIAMDLRTGLFFDCGAVSAVRHHRVGFVEDVIHHSHETFAAKALLLNLRLNYTLAPDLESFVAQYLEPASLLHEARKAFPQMAVLPMPSRVECETPIFR